MALAVAGMAVTPALPAWAGNGIRKDSMGQEWENIKTGSCLKDLYTDKSMYSPGEPVTLTVEPDPGRIMQGDSLYLRVRHLNTTVWEQERQIGGAGTEVFSVLLPEEDFKGYAAEAYLKRQEQVVDYRMTAIDVSSDWSRFPRYGYITKLDHRTDQEISDALQRLKNHHINGLFYYDVFDSQEKPLAGTPQQPDREWQSLAKQTVDAVSLKKTIDMGHSLHMNSFFYNLIFGDYNGYEEKGIRPEWGLYKDERH